jgi:hypothetical protein
MSFPCWLSPVRRISLLGAVVFLAASLASAQSNSAQNQASSTSFSSSTESSSLQGLALLEPLPATPAPSASASPGAGAAAGGQEYGGGGGWKHYVGSRLAFEAGGGFNGPIGNDTDQAGVVESSSGAPEKVPVITWGGNFNLGGGLRFNKRLSALLEYQFMDNKLPGVLIASVNSATGGADEITAGNTHINSITGSPVIDLFPKKSNGVYLVGGFGYYHKSTNFQAPEPVISFYGEYYENVTVSSFTSNQWGGNAGLGLYHRVGGMYGDSHTQLFAEARYTYIHTPPPSQNNGLGTTELIPVTFGVRF